jgi:hypothetical protein
MSASCKGEGDFVPPCLISTVAFLQFTQERAVDFANGEKGGIFLLLSRDLSSKAHNWSFVVPAREPAGPLPSRAGKARIGK